MRTLRAKRMRAKNRLLLAIASACFSLPAFAICLATPIEDELKAAKTVFLATITESKLVGAVSDLKNEGGYRIDHAFVVRERLKGDPASVKHVYTMSLYNDPANDTVVHMAEQTLLIPGESVLVMSTGDDAVQVSLCSPSQKRDYVDLDRVRTLLSTK